MMAFQNRITGHLKFSKGEILLILCCAITYFFAHKLTFFFPDSQQILMLIWPAGGISFAVFLKSPGRLWPALTVCFYTSGIAADLLLTNRSFLAGFGYMSANMVESIACAWIVLKWSGNFKDFSRVKEILALLTGAVFVNALSSGIGAATSVITNDATFWVSWRSWYIGDGLGLLLIGPFVIALYALQDQLTSFWSKKTIEGLIFVMLWIIFNLLIFSSDILNIRIGAHPYMLVALLAWPAIRFGTGSVTFALMLTFCVAMSSDSILSGPSPFVSGEVTVTHRLLDLQLFLAFLAIVGYLLAAGYSDLMAARPALSESEQKYRMLTENMKDVVWTLDTKTLRFVYVSPSVFRLRGFTPEEIMSEPMAAALTEHQQQVIHNQITSQKIEFINGKISSDTYFTTEVEQPCKDGTTVWTEVITNYRFNPKTGDVELNGVTRDISERKQSDEALAEREMQLKESIATKDKFFSIIAHDLKSPFNSIIGFSQLLEEQIQSGDQMQLAEFARIIRNNSENAMHLLTNLLEWSRSQTGLINFNPDYCDMVEIIGSATRLYHDAALQKSIRISERLEVNGKIYADREMLSFILRNLVSNAVKFTHRGGELNISCEQNDKELTIAVKDNGIGIPKERIPKLFQIGESISTVGTRNEKGTGLGLILCKDFVERHGGSIWAESELNGGTLFSFTIPVI